jgi:hypothetical protein
LVAEIAALVALVLRGEAVDTAAKGEELAARYPLAGMSGPMVGEAIVRATGMVNMIREAPPVAPITRSETGGEMSAGGVQDAPHGEGPPERRDFAIDNAMGAAIEAEIGSFVSTATDPSVGRANGREGGAPSAASLPRSSFASGAAAALRRALFKS